LRDLRRQSADESAKPASAVDGGSKKKGSKAAAAAAAAEEKNSAAGDYAQSGRKYKVPEKGLFAYVLYAHYLTEWIEWIGFWIFAGAACGPAATFVVNEVLSMLPRAVNGKKWYVEKFGKERIGGKWAVIPGVI